MSIKIMSLVWEEGPTDPTEKLILLALADYSNDEGRCYPSMIGLAAKASLSERGARKIVRRLEANGWLEIETGGGRGGKNLYRILVDKPGTRNPEPETGNEKPGMSGTKTRNVSALNPEPGSAEPSRTINKPSKSTRKILLSLLSEETVDAFLEVRKAMKAVVTPRSAQMIINQLEGHHDPNEVVNLSVRNGWRGVFPEKVKPTSKVIHIDPKQKGVPLPFEVLPSRDGKRVGIDK